jgi:hypothetical protein
MDSTSRIGYPHVVSTLALVVALGSGGAYAAGLAKNSVASKQIKNGSVQAQDVKPGTLSGAQVGDNTLTGADIDESSLGPVPQATRAQTADSATKADSAATAGSATSALRADNVLVGTVDPDGNLIAAKSLGAVGSTTPGVGTYTVTFDRNVQGCGFVATVHNDFGGNTVPGEAVVNNRNQTADTVLVRTYDSSGTVKDREFSVMVVC